MRAAPALGLELQDAGVEELLRPARLVAVHEGDRDDDRHLEAEVLVGPAHAAVERLLREVDGGAHGFAAHGGVPGAQAQDVPLGQTAADEPLGELGEQPRPGGRVLLVAADRVPLELLGLHAQPGPGTGGPARLVVQQSDGLRQPARVRQSLGKAVRDRLAQRRLGLRLLQCRPQLVDGGHRVVQEVRGAELEQHLRPVLRLRGFAQRPRQVAACRVGRTGGEALVGGLAQLLYDPRVALGVHLQ
ncbi:hypothetical protein [Streptomyces globosus]|uniref:hypothetical protein n=1 Tax=Streptomyces globosus TaxID=68209 RepID=UPI00319E1A4A